MDKTIIGLLFITAGVAYGSLALDGVYNATLCWLVENKWITPPVAAKIAPSVLGRKPTILFYSLVLVIIGLWVIYAQ